MLEEDALIARVCHDLITPCNAISLGIEAYEFSEDKSLLSSIKESAGKANTILKFVRELFITRDPDYSYPVSFLSKLASEFLETYNIRVNFTTNCQNFDPSLSRIILFNSTILKELMPMGGKAQFNISNECVSIIYSGNSIGKLDTVLPTELTYKNIFRFKLLELLKTSGFSVNFSMEKGEGHITEKRN